VAWYDKIGEVAKGVANFTGIPGLIHDIATSGSNDDPWYADGINILKDTLQIGTTPLRGAVKGVLELGEWSYETGGKARREVTETLLEQPFMYNKYKDPGESYDSYTKRVEANRDDISFFQAAYSAVGSTVGAGIPESGYFRDWTDNNLRFLSPGFDLFDEEDRKTAFSDQYTGKFLSGLGDLSFSTVVDPLTLAGFLGKGAAIASKATMLENITGGASRVVFGKFAMTNDRLDGVLSKALRGEGAAVKDIDFLANTTAKEQYSYWRSKKVTNPDAMAYLFGEAKTAEEVVDTFKAVMLKDTKAMSIIAQKDKEAALVLDSLTDTPHYIRQALEGKLDGDILTSPAYNDAISTVVQKLVQGDDRYRAALETVSTGGQLKYGFSRGPFAGKLAEKSLKQAKETFGTPEVFTFERSALHPIIKVVNFVKTELPSGVFNVNDGDSFTELNAFLREVNTMSKGQFGESAGKYADQYLGAATEGERLNIIKLAEADAMRTLFPNFSDDEITKLYQIFDSRRANAIARHNQRGFLSYLENGRIVSAVVPVLGRESANTVVIADMRKLYSSLKSHERVLPGLLEGIDVTDIRMRTEKGMAALSTINDIFKTSVLLRLGYTVRNLTEAQLSMLAKGFAMPAVVAANGKAGLERFLTNRKTGYNRVIDQVNVMSGKVDDVKAMQYEFASEVDKLRAIDMSRQQLGKEVRNRIKDLEDDFAGAITRYIEKEKALGNLVGREEAAALVIPKELKMLREVIADLESVTLYHGTPESTFAYDASRPLALSADANLADRYASQEFTFGLERYISESGRPVPLRLVTRKGPEQKPGSPIGTPAVVAQMTNDEFQSVRAWTQGVVSYENNIVRGNVLNDAGTAFETLRPDQKKFMEKLRRVVERSVITEKTTVYRGITSKGTPYEDIKPGDIVIEQGFTATSKVREIADSPAFVSYEPSLKPILFEIEVPKGHPGLDIEETYKGFGMGTAGPVDREREILLPSGIKFKVVSVIDTIVGEKVNSGIPGRFVKLQAILDKPVKKPYSETLLTAAQRMKADMIDASRAGNIIEVRKGGSKRFSRVDEDTIRGYKDEELGRAVFRVVNGGGNVVPVRSYGKPFYATKWTDLPPEVKQMFIKSGTDFPSWVKKKSWQKEDDFVVSYMKENGYGRLVVADDKRAGGVTHVALPGTMGEEGRTAVAKAYVSKAEARAVENMELPTVEPILNTKAERRNAHRVAKKRERSMRRDVSVSPYYTQDQINAMLNNGIQDAAENIARAYSLSQAHLADMANRVGARVTAAESMSIKQRTGFGEMSIDAGGHSYDLPKVFENASWFMGRTSADQSYQALVATQEMAFTAGMGARTVSKVAPDDPRYFEAWGNVLNMHYRDPETGIMDPVVRKVLDGLTDADILKWMKTPEGRIYANNTYTSVGEGVSFTKLKAGELDDELVEKIEIVRGSVKLYIPDNETALMLSAVKENGKPLSGAEVQNFLRDRFGKQADQLPEINGLLVPTSKEFKDQERLIDTFNRRVFRFLGSMPEDIFARHPLTQRIYESRLKINLNQMQTAKGSDRLTAEELNRAVRGAREEARREVERTLFTIVRRTRASSSQVVQLMFPFYAAFENTMKRWSGIIAENPTVVTNASRTVSQLINGQLIVDQDGNRIDSVDKIGEGNLIVQVPQGFIDSLPKSWREIANNSFKTISIPVKSLDVVTQGQPGNPGSGPYLTLPAYLIVRNRPELEDAFAEMFPAGQPKDVLDLFTPAALKRLRTLYTKDELYVRTFNQMLRYETYNFNSGKRTDAPSLQEVTDKTNKFFQLRSLMSISMPFAISPQMDFYQTTYRQFQNQYGPGEAEAKFLEMYPDYFEATVSLSKSPGGLEANVQTVKNLKKFGYLMANAEASDTPELMGFLANDFDGQYTFSQAAYQWQYREGAYPGSKNTYRQNRNPEEIVREANIRKGWTEFGRIMDGIDAYKIQNGIVSDSDDRMKLFNEAKRLWVQETGKVNFDWYSEYVSSDRAKYERRARVLGNALQDKNWMAQNGERPVVKSMAVYLDVRDKIGQILRQRKELGGSADISTKKNADILAVFDQIKTQLKAESPEFGEFLNRFFINDTVVI
jgi:hypothetical protein